jgi:hypothetical protein
VTAESGRSGAAPQSSEGLVIGVARQPSQARLGEEGCRGCGQSLLGGCEGTIRPGMG